MKIKLKNVAINASLFFGSLLVALLLGELLLRLFLEKPPWVMATSEHHQLFCEYDSLLGWRKIPHKKGWHRMEEYQVIESFNSRGLRGPEYAYEKPAGVTRILILGDSFAEGYTVNFENLFSRVLENELNATGERRFEVINCGTAGYSTDQEFLFFLYEGKKYQQDFTILLLSDNDPWYNTQSRYWRGKKPLFVLEGDRLVLTNVLVPRPVDAAAQNKPEARNRSVFRRSKDWLNVHSYIYSLMVQRIERNHALFSLAVKLGLTDPQRSAAPPREFGVYRKNYNPEIEQAWRVTEAILRQLKEEASAIGSRLLVFYVPSRACIDGKQWQATRRKYGLSRQEWDIEQISRELQRICQENEIPVINPIDDFRVRARTLARTGQHLYFEKDGHWNENGHQLTGELLARAIRAQLSTH